MSSKHQNIYFEQENIGSILFLDVKICRKRGKFASSAYRKPTFSRVFTNYESFIPTHQKRGLLYTLLHGSFSICCDSKTFHFELIIWRLSSWTIIFPRISLIWISLICIKSFLNKLYTPKVIVKNVPKRNAFVKVNKSVYLASRTYRFCWQYAIIVVWETWSRALNLWRAVPEKIIIF